MRKYLGTKGKSGFEDNVVKNKLESIKKFKNTKKGQYSER